MSETTKRCCTCHREMPLSSFNRRAAAADGLQARCRECSSIWYQRNRTEHKRNVRACNDRVRNQWRQKLTQYLAEHPCVDCGEDDVRCLDFDHRDPLTKFDNVSRLITSAMRWSTILAEIEKCDVRCANCHRRITAQRGSHWRQAVYERVRAESAAESLARLERVFQRPSA